MKSKKEKEERKEEEKGRSFKNFFLNKPAEVVCPKTTERITVEKNFRNSTKAPEISIFYEMIDYKKDVFCLGRVISQGVFNKDDKFCMVAKNKGGSVIAKDPVFVFDVSKYEDRKDVIFLNENLDFFLPVECVEMYGEGKWSEEKKRYICKNHMYVIFFNLDGSFSYPTIEEWEIKKDPRFVSGVNSYGKQNL